MPGFAVGCPQRLAVREGRKGGCTAILGVASDPSGSLLAILTRHDVQIWDSGQHNVMLGWGLLPRHAEHDEAGDEGSYVRPGIVWARGGKEVCVLGLDGSLTFFSVKPEEDVLLFTEIEPPEWLDLQPGGAGLSSSLMDSPHAFSVQAVRTLPGLRATCLSAGLWSQHLLLGKEREAVVIDVSWSGHVAREFHLDPPHAFEDATSAPHPTPILLQVDYSDVCHLLAAVLSDGRAVVCNIPSPTFSVKVIDPPPDLQQDGGGGGRVPSSPVNSSTDDGLGLGAAEVVAFSPVDAVLAVGYDDGSVAVFRVLYTNTQASPMAFALNRHKTSSLGLEPDLSISQSIGKSAAAPAVEGAPENGSVLSSHPMGSDQDIALSLFRRLSLSSLGFEARHVGPPMTMEFSPDGGSLAVAHGWSSLNVWDTSQWCRPMTTFPRVPQTPSEAGLAAISCIVWAYRGYRLLVAENEMVSDTEHRASIVRYEMMRWARHAALADTSLCLQGVSSVALIEQHSWNPRLLSWAHVTVPPAYTVNLPLSLVALSPAAQHVAVAGRRGMALYNRSQRKWRMFGNVHQERDLQVAGLAWWGEDAIVVIARQRNAFTILVYPRTHLDKSSLLNEPVSLPPGTRPLFLDCVSDSPRTSPISSRVNGHVRSRSRSSSFSSFASMTFSSTSSQPTGAQGNARQAALTPPSILLVGDGNFLLFYRLARDASGAVTVSFLYDVKVPIQRGPSGSPQPRRHSSYTSTTSDFGLSSLLNMGFGEVPRRVCLLPDVHPRSIAVLSSTGNLYRLEVVTGHLSLVATEVSNFWELDLPTTEERMRPCYVLYCGNNGFSLWLPSLKDERAEHLTLEACRHPFLDPTFNPDVEGVMVGIHAPTSSLIFLTQTCIQPQPNPQDMAMPIPPRFEIGLQRRPIYQVVFRYLLFLLGMFQDKEYPCRPPVPGIIHEEDDDAVAANTAIIVQEVVSGIFDELYRQAETRIQLADALDFLLRSCIEAVAIAHSNAKRNAAFRREVSESSYFSSMSTATDQVRQALMLCRREPSLTLLYEVIVRVARKVEPSRQKYIFPLPELDGQGYGDTPVTLFEKCLAGKKLHTAILYLPLIDPHLDMAHQKDAAMSGLQRKGSRGSSMVMDLNDLKLVHGMALRLLWECLRRGRKDWKMLRQLWRFILKREEALYAHTMEMGHAASLQRMSSSSPKRRLSGLTPNGHHHYDGTTRPDKLSISAAADAGPNPPSSTGTGRPILGFLYRVTVGALTSPQTPPDEASVTPAVLGHAASFANGDVMSSPSTASHPMGGGGFHSGGAPVVVGSGMADGGSEAFDGDQAVAVPSFHILEHADSGRACLGVFCLLSLATLRLRDLADALLLLGSGNVEKVPYPSTKRGRDRDRAERYPWARFDSPLEMMVDAFLAIREQFPAALRNGAARGGHPHAGQHTSEDGRHAADKQRLAVLKRVCQEMCEWEALAAVATYARDAPVLHAALKKAKVQLNEYRSTFVDESMQLDSAVREFVVALGEGEMVV